MGVGPRREGQAKPFERWSKQNEIERWSRHMQGNGEVPRWGMRKGGGGG